MLFMEFNANQQKNTNPSICEMFIIMDQMQMRMNLKKFEIVGILQIIFFIPRAFTRND